jgi:hypothetical protein
MTKLKRVTLILIAGFSVGLLVYAIYSDCQQSTEKSTTIARTAAQPISANSFTSSKVAATVPRKATYHGEEFYEGQIFSGEVTYYCACAKCNGNDAGVNASGKSLAAGMLGCNWLPLGTVLKLNGKIYTVSDRGGHNLDPIGRLDVFIPNGHQEALEAGRQRNIEVIIISLTNKREGV